MPDDDGSTWRSRELRPGRNLDAQWPGCSMTRKSKEFAETSTGHWLQVRHLSVASPYRGRFEVRFDEPRRNAMRRRSDVFGRLSQDNRRSPTSSTPTTRSQRAAGQSYRIARGRATSSPGVPLTRPRSRGRLCNGLDLSQSPRTRPDLGLQAGQVESGRDPRDPARRPPPAQRPTLPHENRTSPW